MDELAPQEPQSIAVSMLEKVQTLQVEISKCEQYQPFTKHTFHGGMYCREVFREAGVVIVGKVHKKEHFYYIISGTIQVTTDDGIETITGPYLLCSKPGTKRAVYAVTDALCMTIHKTDAQTVEEAETELVEYDPTSMYTADNIVKDRLIGETI